MPALKWTLPATQDLWAIDAWLEENASGAFALATLASIRFRAHFLGDFPHGGRPVGKGVRALRVTDTAYIILYRLEADSVVILRIRHEKEDWQVDL